MFSNTFYPSPESSRADILYYHVGIAQKSHHILQVKLETSVLVVYEVQCYQLNVCTPWFHFIEIPNPGVMVWGGVDFCIWLSQIGLMPNRPQRIPSPFIPHEDTLRRWHLCTRKHQIPNQYTLDLGLPSLQKYEKLISVFCKPPSLRCSVIAVLRN